MRSTAAPHRAINSSRMLKQSGAPASEQATADTNPSTAKERLRNVRIINLIWSAARIPLQPFVDERICTILGGFLRGKLAAPDSHDPTVFP